MAYTITDDMSSSSNWSPANVYTTVSASSGALKMDVAGYQYGRANFIDQTVNGSYLFVSVKAKMNSNSAYLYIFNPDNTPENAYVLLNDASNTYTVQINGVQHSGSFTVNSNQFYNLSIYRSGTQIIFYVDSNLLYQENTYAGLNNRLRITIDSQGTAPTTTYWDDLYYNTPNLPPGYYVNGTITDVTSGLKLSGVTVQIYNGSTLKNSTTTSATGVYSIRTYEALEYWVKYTCNGFYDYLSGNFTQPDGYTQIGYDYYHVESRSLSSIYVNEYFYARDNTNKTMLNGVRLYFTDNDIGYTYSILANNGATDINLTYHHNYTITAQTSGYINKTITLYVTNTESTYIDMVSTTNSVFDVQGQIIDQLSKNVISGVTVNLYLPNGTLTSTYTSDNYGWYGVSSPYAPPNGSYTLKASKTGYNDSYYTIVNPDDLLSRGTFNGFLMRYQLNAYTIYMAPPGESQVNFSWISWHTYDMDTNAGLQATYVFQTSSGSRFNLVADASGNLVTRLPYDSYNVTAFRPGYYNCSFVAAFPGPWTNYNIPMQPVPGWQSPVTVGNGSGTTNQYQFFAFDNNTKKMIYAKFYVTDKVGGGQIIYTSSLSSNPAYIAWVNLADNREYTIRCTSPGYTEQTVTVNFSGGGRGVPFYLDLATFQLSGKVTDANGTGLYVGINVYDANHMILKDENGIVRGYSSTGPDGVYVFDLDSELGFSTGDYYLLFWQAGYATQTIKINIPDDFPDNICIRNIVMRSNPEYQVILTVNGLQGAESGFYYNINYPNGMIRDGMYLGTYQSGTILLGPGTPPNGTYTITVTKPKYDALTASFIKPTDFVYNSSSNAYEWAHTFNLNYHGAPPTVTGVPTATPSYVPMTDAQRAEENRKAMDTGISFIPAFMALAIIAGILSLMALLRYK